MRKKKKILVATHNKGKLQEFKSFLTPLGFGVVSLDSEGITQDAPETGKSFLEIARNKALFYSKLSKLPIIAEDSGLEIHALRGFPGIKTHRWLEGSNKERNAAILEKMGGVVDRRATFKVVIAYRYKKDFVHFEGEMKLEIAKKIEGGAGFGYDPILYVPEKDSTLAQMPLFLKNQISHRAKALRKLTSYLRNYKLK
jgi:XTP/dITP diphosphohydrolase